MVIVRGFAYPFPGAGDVVQRRRNHFRIVNGGMGRCTDPNHPMNAVSRCVIC